MKKPRIKAKLHKVEKDFVWVFSTIPRKSFELPDAFLDIFECRIVPFPGTMFWYKKVPGYIYNFLRKKFERGEY